MWGSRSSAVHRLPLGITFACVFVVVALSFARVSVAEDEISKELAYITILPIEDEVVGVRTLGLFLNKTGSGSTLLDVSTGAGKYASRIVLASEAISERAVNILRKEGWIVYIVRLPTSVSDIVDVGKSALMSSPTTTYSWWNSYHFTFVELYLKIAAFGLHQKGFKKLVYLDSDMVLHENLDPLFRCAGDFCAVETSQMFPTHLMVFTTCSEIHMMLLTELQKEVLKPETPSSLAIREFEFFNRLLPINNQELVTCPLFDLDSPELWPPAYDPKSNNEGVAKCSRLAVHMFGDMGRYYLHHTNWLFPNNRSMPSVTHLERGGMKPWHFYTHLLIDLNWEWLTLSETLKPRDLPPTSITEALQTDWLVAMSFTLTASILGFIYMFFESEAERRFWTRVCGWIKGNLSKMDENSITSKFLLSKAMFSFLSLLIGYISVLAALGLCMLIVPMTIHGNPWRTWFSFTILGWTLYYLFFGLGYCRFCFFYGRLQIAGMQVKAKQKRMYAISEYPSSPKHHTLLWFAALPSIMSVALLWLYNDSSIIHKPMFKFWALVSTGVGLLVAISVSFARLAVLWRRYGKSMSIPHTL